LIKKFMVSLFALTFIILSCSDDEITGQGDTTPPAAISDLTVVSFGNNSLGLSWTAPGDDGNSGTAKVYDLRYDTLSIMDNTDWEAAIEVLGEPTPKAVGESEEMVVTGLDPDVTYCFAIKTADEETNWSELSNNICGETTPDTLAPANISDLQVADFTSYSVTLIWTAPGDDDTIGTAKHYDIKYDTLPITELSWSQLTSCSRIPIPSIAGTIDTIIASGFKSQTKYYFAIKATDEQFNWNEISNIDSVLTDSVIPITSLSVADSARDAITLTWTTPGDSSDGPYIQYDIRYSTSAIDSSNWNLATKYFLYDTTIPKTAGILDTFLLTGLSYDTTHYFAIKSADSASNWSNISNVVSGKTRWSRFSYPYYRTTGYGPSSIISTDLNADNYPDVVTVNKNDNNISVFLNNGDNTFTTGVTYNVGPEPNDICVADFDGDNDLDLAVANSYNLNNTISILLNNGSGVFSGALDYDVGYKPISITAGDLDSDGDNDIVAACFESDSIYILINNGKGDFIDAHGWSGNNNDLFMVDPDHQIYNTPDTISLPPDSIIQLFTTTNHVSIYLPVIPSGVTALGRESDNDYYYPLVLEQSRYLLWGFTNIPTYMTQTGKDLFHNVLHFMTQPLDSGNIAFIYSNSTTARRFRSLINSYGYNTDRIKTTNILSTDFSQYDAIIIGPETGYLDTWGSTAQVSAIDNSNKPIIALGDGGYAFYGALGLNIGFGSQPDLCYSAGDGPFGLCSGDLDNDGDSDLVVSNYYSNNVSVLLHDSDDSTFISAVNYNVGSGPGSVFMADLNGDTYPDLSVANILSNDVYILINDGSGVFTTGQHYDVGDGPRSVIAADLNSDGNNDLAVANINSDSVSVLLGNGDGTFQSAVNYWAGRGPISITIADFDSDTYIDMGVANSRSRNMSILWNMTATEK